MNTVTISRTIEEIELPLGLWASVDVSCNVETCSYGEDESTGTPAFCDYDFDVESIETDDISIYDAEENRICVTLTGCELEKKIVKEAIAKFKIDVNFNCYDETVAEDISEELYKRDETAKADAADAAEDRAEARKNRALYKMAQEEFEKNVEESRVQ